MLSRNSRFSPDSEPRTPLGRSYGSQSKSGSNSYKNRIYEEAYDFCHDILREMQDRYDKARNMKGAKTRVIITMNNNLESMRNKARRIGLDPDKEIQENENNAEVKKKILSDIQEAKNLITLLEVTK